jgi:hypothetical protein
MPLGCLDYIATIVASLAIACAPLIQRSHDLIKKRALKFVQGTVIWGLENSVSAKSLPTRSIGVNPHPDHADIRLDICLVLAMNNFPIANLAASILQGSFEFGAALLLEWR